MRRFLLGIAAALFITAPTRADTGQWLILETSEAARPVVVSARHQIPDDAVRAAFPWMTRIEWRYPVLERGMPPPDLLRGMYALEEELERQVEAKDLSMLALVRTGNGLRTWTYYAKDREVAELQIGGIVKARSAASITLVRQEPEWASLREVLSNVRDAQK